MWYVVELIKEGDPRPKIRPRYWLGGVEGGGRTIGRKHVDIRLPANSVSRTHARVSVAKAPFYSPPSQSCRRKHHSTCVYIEDSSAYGTFVKYPASHPSNRAQMAVGHHRRLDKSTPTEVWDGAFLAFGAPHDWWRLGRENFVLVPSRLSQAERNRLFVIADITSVEIGDTWTEESTHLITDECSSSSIKFLSVLAEGKHVVTNAWVEALRHVVAESCRANTDSTDVEAAAKAAETPDEKRFVPPFSSADQAAFAAEDLAAILDDPVKERRKHLFKNVNFAFSREERRSRWVAILEGLGGSTTLAKAITSPGPVEGVVFVQGEHGASKKVHEPVDTTGRTFLPESALAAAIIRANLMPLELACTVPVSAASSLIKLNAAEVTDVATPGPLDSESDVDSDESDTANERRQATRRPIVPMNPDDSVADGDGNASVAKPKSLRSSERGALSAEGDRAEGKPATASEPSRTTASNVAAKKRARPVPGSSLDESELPPAKRTAALVSEEPADGVEKVQATSSVVAEQINNSDFNERSFFSVGELTSGAHVVGGSIEAKASAVSGANVRPFRRRKLPNAKAVPVKLVRYVDGGEGAFARKRLQSEARYQRRRGQDGAKVLSSEEE
ncbi:unnamed protein product [Chondrus crispus]|uniref:FHA domain-containing protein n=1 Tax=Chondrus crispus TaxID=2769 RepID=R7Q8S1_CHOCR|nr:unnamed protein product [Chondrus crispus]CDF34434.1 unnamed protein product [Chondrus crispus]|eukprot:XP_005714253.1 unnamed protein product [Chondrus crispus]